jgi:site-specific recombinase XerD
MLEDLYLTPRGAERARRSWLREPISHYFEGLIAQKFKRSSLTSYANRLLSFGEFLERQGVQEITHLPRWIDAFLQSRSFPAARAANWRSSLNRFVRYLIQENVIPALAPASPTYPHAELVEAYGQFLLEHRGVCHDGLRYILRACRALMSYLATEGVSALDALQPEAIYGFITAQGQNCTRNTLRSTCSALRGFLRYLHRHGVVPRDLAPIVVSPKVYRHEQCPRFLTRTEVEAVLAAINRNTPEGRRDYAMVLLLATYGLRGIEVVRLRLGDLDWRNQAIHIRRRKAGNNTAYPLAVTVSEAIVVYLQGGRPESPHREVFLALAAPFPPLASSSALGVVVRKYLARAGVQVARPGTHTFRYSCAQRLLEHGTPLKSIGDYLGHGDPSSTQRYTKIAIDQLREVATGDGEDLL